MSLAHHNCIMTKAPGFSSATGWHRDFRYWSFQTSNLVTLWLALVDEYPENGCLRVIPGSHIMNLDESRFDSQKFLRIDLASNKDLIDRAVDVRLQGGDVLFFHCLTLHAAGRNQTSSPKMSAVFTFHDAENLPIADSRSSASAEVILSH